jgi:hypothetical protein
MASAPAEPFIPVPIFYKRFTHASGPCSIPSEPENTHSHTTRQTTAAVLAPSSAPNVVKRKRDPDAEECDDTRERHGKAKKDERSGQRTELRADLEIKRKNWLFAHRALFEPLLPSSSTAFFSHLITEMAMEGKAMPPVPMRDFLEQPKLIVGGEMKEYQLAGLSFLAHMYHNGRCIVSRHGAY